MVFEKYQRFIEEQFEIVNKQGEAVSFFLNLPQQQFVKQATGRDIVLKARQEGFSSLVGGIFTTDFILDPNSYSVVLADISDNAEGLLDRVKFSLKSYEEKNGFKIKRQKGTHVILRNNGKMVVVPVHHATIPIGTLKSIEKQSGVNFREINE